MAALSVCQKEFANNRRRGRDCDLTMLRSDADIAPHGLLPARSRRGREDGTERKVELGCRKVSYQSTLFWVFLGMGGDECACCLCQQLMIFLANLS